MKKSITKSATRVRSRTASEELIRSLSKVYPDKKVPIAQLTAIAKKYVHKQLDPNSQLIKRLQVDNKNVSAPKLAEYLQENTHHQKGTRLSDDAIKRAHAAFCNNEGKMTFEYILKKCEEMGIPMTEKVAKGIVRKYGKRKDHLTVEDCSNVIHRRYDNLAATAKRAHTPKKNRSNSNSQSKSRR